MKTVLILSIVMMGLSALAANQIKSDVNSGKVEFEAVGRPSMIKIKGTGEGVKSNLKADGNKISGEVTFKLATLKTGIEMRDEHMLDKYLQVKQYPEAKLVFTDFVMPAAWSVQNPLVASSTFRAKLILHGVEKEVTGTYSIESQQLQTTAQLDVKLSDFKVDIPVYLGVKVADVVKVSIAINKMSVVQ